MPNQQPHRLLNCLLALLLFATQTSAQQQIPVAPGWAKNSINTVVFRKNSLASYKNLQFIAFYDSTSHLVLGRRRPGAANWTLHPTQYTGDTRDAHRSISIIVGEDAGGLVEHDDVGAQTSEGLRQFAAYRSGPNQEQAVRTLGQPEHGVAREVRRSGQTVD